MFCPRAVHESKNRFFRFCSAFFSRTNPGKCNQKDILQEHKGMGSSRPQIFVYFFNLLNAKFAVDCLVFAGGLGLLTVFRPRAVHESKNRFFRVCSAFF
jgi:hypothetical protein